MEVKLHLMNDRKVISTVLVGELDLVDSFKLLMDNLITDIDDNYSNEHYDANLVISNVMKADARKAKETVSTREEMSSFVTGNPEEFEHEYSVVVHEIY